MTRGEVFQRVIADAFRASAGIREATSTQNVIAKGGATPVDRAFLQQTAQHGLIINYLLHVMDSLYMIEQTLGLADLEIPMPPQETKQ